MAISWTERILILLLISGLAVLALFKPTIFLGVEALAIVVAAGFAAYLFPSVFLGIAIASLAQTMLKIGIRAMIKSNRGIAFGL